MEYMRQGRERIATDHGMEIKMFGHSDFDLILRVYYAQNDDARLVAETSKIDFGLGLPKTV